MGNHQANFAHGPARQGAELQARKGKTRKDPNILEKANDFQSREVEGDEDADVSSSHAMDTQAEVWSKSPAEESSIELTCEGRHDTRFLMLVARRDCGKGYERTISALETAPSLGTSMVCIQKPLVGRPSISHSGFNLYLLAIWI